MLLLDIIVYIFRFFSLKVRGGGSSAGRKQGEEQIESVLAFIKGGNLQPGSQPGFGHALKLSYNTIAKDRLSVVTNENKQTLSYRYRFSDDVATPSVGLYTALMDELSTNACFSAGSPSPPGVSLQMQTELLQKSYHKQSSPHVGSEIDVVNTVTKLGRTVSHTRTDFYCAATQTPLAFSSHVKYMPTGSRLVDFLFTNKFVYHMFAEVFLPRRGNPKLYNEKPLINDVIGCSLEYHGLGRASFKVTGEHTNPFGALHGGCHAMVMEQAGTAYAKAELEHDIGDSLLMLEAMQIEFLGAAKGTVDVICETIGKLDEPPSLIHVRVMLKKGERVLSEGKLRYSVS